MYNSRLLTLTLVISFLMTSGALANDQKSKLSSLSDATAEKLQQNKLNNRDIYIDNDDEVEGSGSRGEIHDALERDNDDIDSSGSGYGEGDDEDDIHPIKGDRDNTHVINKEPTTNIHQSGDGSESRVNLGNSDNTDDDDDDYIENHKEREPLPIDGEDDSLYFDNSNNNSNTLSTSTDNKIASTTTDDEDIGGGDFSNRRKETEYNRNGLENVDPNHIPAVTTDTTYGPDGNGVLIMDTKNENRQTSFFAQPGILAAVVGGAVVGLLFAILVVMFIVYRMRKKDEGSYALDEPKRSPQANSYTKNHNNREFYA